MPVDKNNATKSDSPATKAPINRSGLIVAAVLVIVIVAISFMLSGFNAAQKSQTNETTQQPSFKVTSFGTTVPQSNATNSTAGETRFAGLNYSQIAHLLYGPNQTSIKFEAPGFDENLTSISAYGANFTFTKLGAVGFDRSFYIPKGYSLYYLEGSYGDDSPPTGEYSLIDDGVILVNPAGYVIGNVTQP